ncbi:MAG: hypothetical protein GY910_06685 [bacterium]|nr:hypothetical protein [Deltaproteobacteria bacterium]MCP4904649.1 hypothetical protein [bacterium]
MQKIGRQELGPELAGQEDDLGKEAEGGDPDDPPDRSHCEEERPLARHVESGRTSGTSEMSYRGSIERLGAGLKGVWGGDPGLLLRSKVLAPDRITGL